MPATKLDLPVQLAFILSVRFDQMGHSRSVSEPSIITHDTEIMSGTLLGQPGLILGGGDGDLYDLLINSKRY